MKEILIVRARDLQKSISELRTTSKTVYLSLRKDNGFFLSTLNRKRIFNRFSKVREAINLQKDYLTLILAPEIVKKLLSIINLSIEKYGEDAFILISKNQSNNIIVEILNERLQVCNLEYIDKLKNLL